MAAHSPLAMLLLVTPYTMVYLANQCKETPPLPFPFPLCFTHEECHSHLLMSCEA